MKHCSSHLSFVKRQSQQGVAIVTALLLTALAITLVASLFWQQQVQVRSIENQRFQLQKKWVLRGALDWAMLILREDAKTSNNVDHLSEPWAIQLAETRLDQYVENGKLEGEDNDATLSGRMSDAQGLFNLNNLSQNGQISPVQLAIFTRLLRQLGLKEDLGKLIAQHVSISQDKFIPPKKEGESAGGGSASSATGSASAPGDLVGPLPKSDDSSLTGSSRPDTPLPSPEKNTIASRQFRFTQVEDLLALSEFTPDIVNRLKPYVIFLPKPTKINVNTAPPEILMAVFEKMSISDAASIVNQRERNYFTDFAKFRLYFPEKTTEKEGGLVEFKTNYFLIYGKVRLNRSNLEIQSLVQREGVETKVLWTKES